VGIGGVEPVQKRLPGFDHDSRTVHHIHLVLQVSHGPAFVTVVQPADLRNGDDLALSHDRSPFGSVLCQDEVRSGAVIVGEIAFQQMAKVPMTQDHHMVQAFTTNRADQPSTNAFCQGLRGAMTTSFMVKDWITATKLTAMDRITRSPIR
jgi:hypothetical protein